LAFLKPEGQTAVLVRALWRAARHLGAHLRDDISVRRRAALRDALLRFRLVALRTASACRTDRPRRRAELRRTARFASFDQALSNVPATAADDTNLVWEQGVLDVCRIPHRLDRSQFISTPASRGSAAGERRLRFLPTAPERVPTHAMSAWSADPRGTRRRGCSSRLRHILDGTDHLLFLLCLVIPFRRMRAAGGDHRVHCGALDPDRPPTMCPDARGSHRWWKR
jgi:hypothetical protein